MLLGDGNDKNNNTLIGAIQMNTNIMLFDLYIRKGNFFFSTIRTMTERTTTGLQIFFICYNHAMSLNRFYLRAFLNKNTCVYFMT